jgi:hypothetical protein
MEGWMEVGIDLSLVCAIRWRLHESAGTSNKQLLFSWKDGILLCLPSNLFNCIFAGPLRCRVNVRHE